MTASRIFTSRGLPLGALAVSLVRWIVQDSHNLYTAISKRFGRPTSRS